MIFILLSCAAIFLSFYLIFRIRHLNQKYKKIIDEQLYKEEELFTQKRKELNSSFEKERQELTTQINLLNDVLNSKSDQYYSQIGHQKELIDQEIKNYREIELTRITNLLEKEAEIKKKEFADKFNSINLEFLDLAEQRKKELDNLIALVEEYQQKRAVINEAIFREKEIREQQDFYRILINDCDKEDIKILKTIEPTLHNREALNKLIFEVFYKKPLNDMLARVLQNKEFCGIYKITNLQTQECYIGKSTNIKTRWTQHIKTSLNIGTIAKTKIHTALQDIGVDNFSFEVLEQCSKEVYSEREKYWINFYESQTFGYNIQK